MRLRVRRRGTRRRRAMTATACGTNGTAMGQGLVPPILPADLPICRVAPYGTEGTGFVSRGSCVRERAPRGEERRCIRLSPQILSHLSHRGQVTLYAPLRCLADQFQRDRCRARHRDSLSRSLSQTVATVATGAGRGLRAAGKDREGRSCVAAHRLGELINSRSPLTCFRRSGSLSVTARAPPDTVGLLYRLQTPGRMHAASQPQQQTQKLR